MIYTYDKNGSEIDNGFNINIKMSETAQIQSFVIDHFDKIDGTVNGQITCYEFILTTIYPLLDGDQVSVSVPPQVKVPDDGADL